MAKTDSLSGGLVPALVLAAGLFSSTFLRVGGPIDHPKPAATGRPGPAPSAEDSKGSASALADLRPVIDLIA